MKGVLCHICVKTFRFFENQAQNLNTPQNNSASWDLQTAFNLAFKGSRARINEKKKIKLIYAENNIQVVVSTTKHFCDFKCRNRTRM